MVRRRGSRKGSQSRLSREAETDTGAQLALSFVFSPGPQRMEWPTFRVGLLTAHFN